MLLIIGRFSLDIDWRRGPIAFPGYEQPDTEAERRNPEDRFVLHLEEGDPVADGYSADGWQTVLCEDRPRVMYRDKENPAFSLRYMPGEREATVITHRPGNGCAKLGMQYGMMALLHERCVGLHGVTLLCGDEIVILSAPSGTGKTTLGNLLEKYCGAIAINGDFALLSPTEEGVIFEPTPFCGTSGRCLNHRVRVDRVVFLEQSPADRWQALTGREAVARFMSNAFIPTWDEGMRRAVQRNILECISAVKVEAFAFAPEREAAEVFFSRLQS